MNFYSERLEVSSQAQPHVATVFTEQFRARQFTTSLFLQYNPSVRLKLPRRKPMYKQIISADDLVKSKLSGMAQLAGIVKRTLGPGGLPIILARVGQALDGTPLGPKITKDGVSVAEECASKDEAEDVVIQAVKAICKKTNTDAGDGTTTAIVLGEAILEQAQKALKEDPTLNPQLVKEEIEKASAEIVAALRASATSVSDMKSIEEVATISANGERSIGVIIRKAFEHVGAEGVVTVDEGAGTDVTLEVVEGYRFNRGAQSRSDFFNNKDRTQFEGEKAAVVFFDGKILNFTDIIPTFHILAGVDDNGQPTKKLPPIVFVANEFSRDVIQFMLMQKLERGFQLCAIEGPHMSHVRTGYYDDMAAYTGGNRLGNGARALTAIEEEDIGYVDKIVVDQYKTTMYGGQGSEEAILERVDQLKAMKALAESPYDAQVINDRIASLTSGIAKIGVGGATELEIKEKYDRIEDALNASRAAIQEGVVPGGGVALLRIVHAIKAETVGQKIMKEALSAPFIQILVNIGIPSSEIAEISKKLLESPGCVYDARDKKIKNAFEAGIIDPVKVTRSALENAVSIAGLLSTAGGAIIYQRDK
jgi:chaperonin GroEL